MIIFERPEMLLILAGIPLVIIMHYLGLVSFKAKTFKFANFETIKRISKEKYVFSKNISQLIIRIIFIIVFVFGLAGAGYEYSTESYNDEIIFAIDNSGSMLADDIEPTRLDAAKDAVTRFIRNLSIQKKIGVVSFTSLVEKEQHPTIEKAKIIAAVEGIGVKRTKGTSIGIVINYVSALFSQSDGNSHNESQKALVIITDGQENLLSKEELKLSVEAAAEEGISLYVIGVGSSEGGQMSNGTIGSFVLNEDNLRLLVEEGKAKYISAQSKESIIEGLGSLFEKADVQRTYDLPYILLLLSFIILIVEWFFSNYLSKAFP